MILGEVQALLDKKAIEFVPPEKENEGFYSTFFIVQKKPEGLRPILNLRPLNQYIQKRHFKMESLRSVKRALKPGDWMSTVDLKDAYMHVPIHISHRKYLRFNVGGKSYQFKVLPFGLSSAPRVFTKVLAPVIAKVRMEGAHVFPYLDDILNKYQFQSRGDQMLQRLIHFLVKGGFLINVPKSFLTQARRRQFIGGMFDTLTFKVYLPEDRMNMLIQFVTEFKLRQMAPARLFLKLLGTMAACIEVVLMARLYMRPIQLYLMVFWKPSSRELEQNVVINDDLRRHLTWWQKVQNLSQGAPLGHPKPDIVLTTDSSSYGWGGHVQNRYVQGTWKGPELQWHINMQELVAVLRSCIRFENVLKNKCVLVQSDNTTVVSYINRMGGTKSPSLCMKVWQLWQWAIKANVWLIAVHLPGEVNCLADKLSRETLKESEWALNRVVCRKIFQKLGKPVIDLFATVENRQTQVFCSRYYHPEAFQVNALNMNWRNLLAYAYPPINLLHIVLDKVESDPCVLILITPLWPRRSWFPRLLDLMIEIPIQLPIIPDLLSQWGGGGVSSRSRQTPIIGLESERRHLIEEGFSREVVDTIQGDIRQSTKEVYSRRWSVFANWCAERSVDPCTASISQICAFLQNQFNKGVAYGSLAVFRSAISKFHKGLNGKPVGQNMQICRFLKGAFNAKPPVKSLLPSWDLAVVLEGLRKPPFAPSKSISMKCLTWKTAFLIAITSGRRCSEMQALGRKSPYIRFEAGGVRLRTVPGFLPKTATPIHLGQDIVVPEYSEKELCPRRTIKIYIKRTTEVVSNSENHLFVTFGGQEKGRQVSKRTISGWLVKVIKETHDSQGKLVGNVRAHSTRAMTASWAMFNRASFIDVLKAADWRTGSTFARHYKLDLWRNREGLVGKAVLQASEKP